MERIHCLGIGGIGMSGMAEMLHTRGYVVTGSDVLSNQVTQHLMHLGIVVESDANAAQLIDQADRVIYSSAITETHPNRRRARQKGIPCLSRGEMLSVLMRGAFSIAIAGSHGKTSTTGLVSQLLNQHHLNPSVLIGGFLNRSNSNVALGNTPYFLAEADESDGSFLFLHPTISVVTNIDNDHLEYYDNDFNQLIQAYSRFLCQTRNYAVICQDDPYLARITVDSLSASLVTYGFTPSAMIQGAEFSQFNEYFTLKIIRNKLKQPDLFIQAPLLGKHNAYNVLAAVAVGSLLGISDVTIQAGLKHYQGVSRRLERLGSLKVSGGTVQIFDDYGHHPKEIEATVCALRCAYPEHRIILVFQPHRYSRTNQLFHDFVTVLSTVVDYLLLLPIYAAGEQSPLQSNDPLLSEAIRKKGGQVTLVAASDLRAILQQTLLKNDIVIFQGAGDISQLARKVMKTWMMQEECLLEKFL